MLTGQGYVAENEVFRELFVNEGKLELIVHLYEPNAPFVERNGEVVSGSKAIGEHLLGLLSIKPKIRIQRRKKSMLVMLRC